MVINYISRSGVFELLLLLQLLLLLVLAVFTISKHSSQCAISHTHSVISSRSFADTSLPQSSFLGYAGKKNGFWWSEELRSSQKYHWLPPMQVITRAGVAGLWLPARTVPLLHVKQNDETHYLIQCYLCSNLFSILSLSLSLFLPSSSSPPPSSHTIS